MRMRNAILVSTLGFDEKFTIRSLMRNMDGLSKVITIVAEPIDEKAQRALSIVKDFIERFMESIPYESLTVDPLIAYDTISKLKEKFRESPASNYVINVSGGMRALIIELITAALLAKISGEVEIELENFRGVIKLPLKLLCMHPLSSEEYKVLKALTDKGPTTSKDLMKVLEVPRSSFYRYLRELIRKGLVIEEREGRRTIYITTELAKIVV